MRQSDILTSLTVTSLLTYSDIWSADTDGIVVSILKLFITKQRRYTFIMFTNKLRMMLKDDKGEENGFICKAMNTKVDNALNCNFQLE